MYVYSKWYVCMYVWCVQTNAPNLYPWELIRRVGCSPPTPTHLSVGSWARSCMCAGSTLLWFSLKIVAHSFIHSRYINLKSWPNCLHTYIHTYIHTYMRINMCILTLEHSLIHTYMHTYIIHNSYVIGIHTCKRAYVHTYTYLRLYVSASFRTVQFTFSNT